jgi:hypothetical protein
MCIIQDNVEDKMGKIYDQAVLTIVVASGRDSNAGLPGVRQGTRKIQQDTLDLPHINHISLTEPQHFDQQHYLRDLIWKTRAWTFQDQMLSQRCLIFSEEQVYWMFQGGNWREDTHLGVPAPLQYLLQQDDMRLDANHGYPGKGLSILEGLGNYGPTYDAIVQDYAARKICQGSDIFNAIQGVLSVITLKTGQELIWGLPTLDFETSLCWDGTIDGVRNVFRPDGVPETFQVGRGLHGGPGLWFPGRSLASV